MTIKADIQKLEVSPIVELYELDLNPIETNEIFYFHNGVNELGTDVVFNGITYNRLPIDATGFNRSGDGRPARPRIVVANIGGLIGELARQENDLIGAKVTRTRTLLKYLDAINFDQGNPTADPNQILDREIWYVDRRANENQILVEFELTSAYDLTDVKLPRRQVIQNVCTWQYRSPECGYTGGPVADINDQPTSDPNQDRCGKRLQSCKLRFGENAQLPYGGFPGAGLFR